MYKAVDDEVLSAQDNIEYDAAGNLKRDQRGYMYVYDYENRLTQITRSDPEVTIAEYAYDALGRRIEKYDAIADETTRYYHNDNWQVLTETNENGTAQRWFIYGNYIDEVLVMVAEGTPDEYYYYAHDHLYSPVAFLDDEGEVVERYEYDVYGMPTIWNADFTSERSTSNYNNPVMFTGQRLDQLDNNVKFISYYKGRYYDPITGRMYSHDRIGYGDGLNLYQYVGSNPIRYFDPWGLIGLDDPNIRFPDRATGDNDSYHMPEGSGPNCALMNMYCTPGSDHPCCPEINNSTYNPYIRVNIVSVFTTKWDYWLWRLYGGYTYEVGTERNEEGEIIKHGEEILVDILEGFSSCISELNLSGHGSECGIACEFAWKSRINQDISISRAKRIANKLCKDAVVNICSCGGAKNAIKQQILANKFQAEVCACDSKVTFSCYCIGDWICVEPNQTDINVLEARDKQDDNKKKKNKK